MKRTLKKIGISAVFAAAILASSSFISCQTSFDDMSEIETFSKNLDARAAKKDASQMTDSQKIDEMYKKMTKPKEWEYKGEEIACTRLLGEVASLLPIDEIEDDNLRYLAKTGVRLAEAATKYLDSYLNNCTMGLFGVVTDVFWPKSSEGPSKDTLLIVDKIKAVEEKLDAQSTLIQNCSGEILSNIGSVRTEILKASDLERLNAHVEKLTDMKKIPANKYVEAYMRKVSNRNTSFLEYMNFLSNLTGNTFETGAVIDPKSSTEDFFNQVTTPTVDKRSFADICSGYSRYTNAWGYEYDTTMREFAKNDLIVGVQLMNIMKAAYSPFLDNVKIVMDNGDVMNDYKVNYNREISNLLAYVQGTGKNALYNTLLNMINGQTEKNDIDKYTFVYNKTGETVTPAVIANSVCNPEKLYKYLIAFLCRKSENKDYPSGIFPADYVNVALGETDLTSIPDINKDFEGMDNLSNEELRTHNLQLYISHRNSCYEEWNRFESLYNSYVGVIDGIYKKLVNDKLGYVTCMIPGVERTFTTLMGHVRFGYRTRESIGRTWSQPELDWSKRLYHGQDIKCSSYCNYLNDYPVREFTDKYDGTFYSAGDTKKLKNNTFEYMTEDEYKKIYNFYHLNGNKLYKSVPAFVVDKDNNVLSVEKDYTAKEIKNPTLTEIFYYGAGIGFSYTETTGEKGTHIWTPSTKAKKSLVSLERETNSAVLNPKGRDEGFIYKEWATEGGNCPVPNDTTELFEVAKRYAFEEGTLEAVKTEDMGDRTQYKIVSHALDGTLKDSWEGNSKKDNQIVWQLENPRSGLTKAEDASNTPWEYAEWALYGGNPTYVFPSVVHNMGWNTYWEK